MYRLLLAKRQIILACLDWSFATRSYLSEIESSKAIRSIVTLIITVTSDLSRAAIYSGPGSEFRENNSMADTPMDPVRRPLTPLPSLPLPSPATASEIPDAGLLSQKLYLWSGACNSMWRTNTNYIFACLPLDCMTGDRCLDLDDGTQV